MNVTYLHDEDLDFLQHCSEEQLADFARLLTHNEKGKARLSSVLSHNELFKAMEGHPEQHRRNWQLIAGEFQHTAATVSPTNCADTENSTARFCWMSQNG